MTRCECCFEECVLVFPVESADPTVPAGYELLCDACVMVVELARRINEGLDVRELLNAGVMEVVA